MLETHAKYERKYLLRQLEKYQNFSEFERLSDEQLRVRVAREMTKQVVAMDERDTQKT